MGTSERYHFRTVAIKYPPTPERLLEQLYPISCGPDSAMMSETLIGERNQFWLWAS